MYKTNKRKQSKYVDPKGYVSNGKYVNPKSHPRKYNIKTILGGLTGTALLGALLLKRKRGGLLRRVAKEVPRTVPVSKPVIIPNTAKVQSVPIETPKNTMSSKDQSDVQRLLSIMDGLSYGKFSKVRPGYYMTKSNKGVTVEILQLEEGSYRNYWLVSDERSNHADPVKTLRVAKDIALNWD